MLKELFQERNEKCQGYWGGDKMVGRRSKKNDSTEASENDIQCQCSTIMTLKRSHWF